MADVVIETYQICLGTGPSDVGLIVYVPGLVSLEHARASLRHLAEQRRLGALDPSLFGTGADFFIRTAPGTQTAPVSDHTAPVILSELAASKMSVALFARHQNPNGFVRIGSAPADVIARFAS